MALRRAASSVAEGPDRQALQDSIRSLGPYAVSSEFRALWADFGRGVDGLMAAIASVKETRRTARELREQQKETGEVCTWEMILKHCGDSTNVARSYTTWVEENKPHWYQEVNPVFGVPSWVWLRTTFSSVVTETKTVDRIETATEPSVPCASGENYGEHVFLSEAAGPPRLLDESLAATAAATPTPTTAAPPTPASMEVLAPALAAPATPAAEASLPETTSPAAPLALSAVAAGPEASPAETTSPEHPPASSAPALAPEASPVETTPPAAPPASSRRKGKGRKRVALQTREASDGPHKKKKKKQPAAPAAADPTVDLAAARALLLRVAGTVKQKAVRKELQRLGAALGMSI